MNNQYDKWRNELTISDSEIDFIMLLRMSDINTEFPRQLKEHAEAIYSSYAVWCKEIGGSHLDIKFELFRDEYIPTNKWYHCNKLATDMRHNGLDVANKIPMKQVFDLLQKMRSNETNIFPEG